jgi:hypothetical protein
VTTLTGHTRHDNRRGPTIIVGAYPGTVTLLGYAGDFPHFQAQPFRLELSPEESREHAYSLLLAADVAERPCCARGTTGTRECSIPKRRAATTDGE